jgi:hypothetical protein
MDCKSPELHEPVWFGTEETLGMILSQPPECFLSRSSAQNVLRRSSSSVFCTKCTEEEFVIGQMVRSSGMDLLYLLLLEGGRGCRCTKFEVNRTTIE